MHESSPNMSPESETHVPGEAGVWVFVLGDMLVFGLFFTVFVYYRGLDIDVFLQAQTTLNPNYGALNTLLLLLSSWFVVLAVSDVREATGKIAPTLFLLAFVCGCGFAIVKFFEYGEKLNAGIGVTTNDFFMYYYIFTGIHFLHVLIGMGVLVFLWAMARAGVSQTQDMKLMESGAIYWHMVDLLWIVLFPLLYLMR